MKKEFVPYDIAVALKELGFDESCFAIFNEKMNNEITFLEGIQRKNSTYKNVVTAPLYQQSLRWFREKYNIDSEIYMNHEFGNKFYTYLILELKGMAIDWESEPSHRFTSYEEAEDGCLKELIEIVKNK